MAPPFLRYVLWLERRWRAITLLAGAALAASLYLTAFHLPVRADLSNLLPADVPAIRDLRKLEARLAAHDTMLAVVVADRPADRAAAAAALTARIRALDPALVERVEADDDDIRAFLRAHRHLYVPLADLEAADRALTESSRRPGCAPTRCSSISMTRTRTPPRPPPPAPRSTTCAPAAAPPRPGSSARRSSAPTGTRR